MIFFVQEETELQNFVYDFSLLHIYNKPIENRTDAPRGKILKKKFDQYILRYS